MRMRKKVKNCFLVVLTLVLSAGAFSAGGSVSLAFSGFMGSSVGAASGGVYAEAEKLEDEAEEQGTEYDGYIFKLKDSGKEALKEEIPDGVEKVPFSNGTFTAEELDQIAEFAPKKTIEYIEPNYRVHLFDSDVFSQADPDDPYYTGEQQWNLDLMHVPAIWNYGIEGQDLDDGIDMDYDGVGDNDPIVIGVIDSGLKEGHEDFDFARVVEGKSFVPGVTSTDDELGHGTFVSGMIMATKDNGVGIAGIAQDVRVMPIRVFQGRSADTSVIVSAIQYAVEERRTWNASGGTSGTNLSVLNMSLGSAGASTAMETAINEAKAEGIIVVCAAGNDGNTTASYPAQYAIGVGSTDQTSTVSSYSQRLSSTNGSGYENKVWVMAPGEKVSGPYYTSTSSYLTGSGTSFSSPEVAALAAICKGLDNDMTHSAFQSLLKETAVPKSGSAGTIRGQDVEYGWGCVDFEKTVRALIGDLTGTSSAVVEVHNGAGSVVPDAEVRIYEAVTDTSGTETFGTEIFPDAEGVYTLSRGKRYLYRAYASKYEEQSGPVVALTEHKRISIVLAGQVYPTRFVVRNTANEMIRDAEITLSTTTGRAVTRSANGTFLTRNGSYKYTIKAGGYFPVSGTYVIDDMQEPLSAADGYTVNVLMHGDIDVCSVAFTSYDVDRKDITKATKIRVFDAEDHEIALYEDGYYKLPPGTYTCTAENADFRKVGGTFRIGEDSLGLARMKRVYLTEKLHVVYLITRPVNLRPDITVTNGLGEVEEATDNSGIYRLKNGTYRYTIALDGYVTYTGSFTVEDKMKTVEVILYKDSVGGTIQDDGTAGDRYLTIGNSFYTKSSLQKHASKFAGDTLEGIRLSDIAEYYQRNPQAVTSVSVTSRDGRRVTEMSAEEWRDFAVVWKEEEGVTVFGLCHSGTGTMTDGDISVVDILYHDHSEVQKRISEPTCTGPGQMQYICTECGEIRYGEIPALGHDYDQNGICRRCGSEQIIREDDTFIHIGERAVSLTEMKRFTTDTKYTYIESMDGSSYSMGVTGITLRDLFEHFSEADQCVTSVNVTGTDGYSGVYQSSGFDQIMIAWLIDGAVPGSYETDNGLRIAVNGGRSGDWLFSPTQLDATAAEHSYGSSVTIAPTCGEEGYTTRTCGQCGHVDQYDRRPATGQHQWDNGHDMTDSQGNPTGSKIYYCTVCGTSRIGEDPGQPDDGARMDFSVKVPANGAVTVTAPDGGWKSGDTVTNTFVVSSENACVLILQRPGSDPEKLSPAVHADGTCSFSVSGLTEDTVITAVIAGDADGDGKVSAADVTLLQKVLLGKASLSAEAGFAVDTNADGKRTAADLLRLKKVTAGEATLAW